MKVVLTDEQKQANIEIAREAFDMAKKETDPTWTAFHIDTVLETLILAGAGYEALDPKGEKSAAAMRAETEEILSAARGKRATLPDLTDPEVVAQLGKKVHREYYESLRDAAQEIVQRLDTAPEQFENFAQILRDMGGNYKDLDPAGEKSSQEMRGQVTAQLRKAGLMQEAPADIHDDAAVDLVQKEAEFASYRPDGFHKLSAVSNLKH